MTRLELEQLKQRIAYSIFEKRHIVKNQLDLFLSGNEKTDYYGAESFLRDEVEREYLKEFKTTQMKKADIMSASRVILEYDKYSEIPCYRAQIEIACEIVKHIISGKRFIDITGPFQVGKTGLFLVIVEIMLRMWEEDGKIGRAIIIPMNGKIDIEDQLNDRTKQYAFTSTIQGYNGLTKVRRVNAGKRISNELEELVKSSTEQAPIMIIADEAYWGTEKGGRFAKLIIKNLKENPNSIVIGVSATQYEQDYSTENVFHKVYMKLSDGYVGPSKISGVKLPHEPDYQEKDVTIEESIPLNLKYYTGRTTDKSKVKVLLDFLLEKKYFSECNVSKWIDIDSAEHAASYLESKKFNVIRHFGKHLKEPLLKKLPSNGKYSLVVVDALQCSTTLPKDIVIGIDLTSFTLEDEVPNLTKLQELYGRFCGYGKNGMKLISCPGLKSYVEAYKDGPITIQPHLRVTKPISGSRILYFSEKFKSENEAWVAKQESEIQIVSDELFSKLQACAVKYKKDAYKNQKGNKETIDILNQISNSDIKQFYYRGIEMPPNDSLARTWSAAQCQSGILWDKIKKVAWGFYRYEQSDNKNGQWNTNNKSLYAGKM